MGCCLVTWFLLTVAFLVLGILFGKKDPPKLGGVYRQRGKYYWPKVIAFYLLMRLRKVSQLAHLVKCENYNFCVILKFQWKDSRDSKRVKDHTRLETYDSGYGTKSKCSPEEMDKVQPLSDHFQAIDAIYFNGANKEGFCIISGTARRQHGVVNGFLILRFDYYHILKQFTLCFFMQWYTIIEYQRLDICFHRNYQTVNYLGVQISFTGRREFDMNLLFQWNNGSCRTMVKWG